MASFPIRCHECRRVVGNLWNIYWELVGIEFDKGDNMIWTGKGKFSEDQACDELKIFRPCCRNVLKNSIQYNRSTRLYINQLE